LLTDLVRQLDRVEAVAKSKKEKLGHGHLALMVVTTVEEAREDAGRLPA
jgi:hypothetical protein